MDCIDNFILRTPPDLYSLSITSITNHLKWCDYFRTEFRSLPDNVLFDLYYKMFEEKHYKLLCLELGTLDVFSRMIKVTRKRAQLLQTFQALVDHGCRVSQNLVADFTKQSKCAKDALHIIDAGLRLGGFLSEIGWYSDSATVLKIVEELCLKNEQCSHTWRRMLDCYHKLLHVQAIYCMFTGASKTFKLANDTIDLLKSTDDVPNLAGLYTEFSLLFFIRSEYDKAYKWSIEAMRQLTPSLPPRIILDVLRLASKACVIKRQFKKAGLLIMQAVCLANEFFKADNHPCYADTLMDYGFYLLNFDSIAHSVQIYNEALEYRKSIFGENNIHTAVAHEDLAYALYVHEYSSGNFTKARYHSERAITILNNLVPTYHLLLASAQRVKALILEEIALDYVNNQSEPSSQFELLNESEKLHMTALTLAHSAFGEKNVQTAKHYGNLGRLYQSMRKYEDAERMHLRAIAIKEELLGREDYEVGLSIGHLASLYNYHMNQHRKAEKLYYRSIAISLKLFGKTYSGLEYDYRGLLHVYTELKDMDRMLEYYYILSDWKELREKHAHKDISPTNTLDRPKSIAEITQNFFDMI